MTGDYWRLLEITDSCLFSSVASERHGLDWTANVHRRGPAHTWLSHCKETVLRSVQKYFFAMCSTLRSTLHACTAGDSTDQHLDGTWNFLLSTAKTVCSDLQTELVLFSRSQNKHVVKISCGGGHRSYGFSSKEQVDHSSSSNEQVYKATSYTLSQYRSSRAKQHLRSTSSSLCYVWGGSTFMSISRSQYYRCWCHSCVYLLTYWAVGYTNILL